MDFIQIFSNLAALASLLWTLYQEFRYHKTKNTEVVVNTLKQAIKKVAESK